jgi:hypothetical protein
VYARAEIVEVPEQAEAVVGVAARPDGISAGGTVGGSQDLSAVDGYGDRLGVADPAGDDADAALERSVGGILEHSPDLSQGSVGSGEGEEHGCSDRAERDRTKG